MRYRLPIFQTFKNSKLLSKIPGGALKLYIYLGLSTDNWGVVTWVSRETLIKYFQKDTRTVDGWIQKLKDLKLIERMQMEVDGVSYTFLRPYGNIQEGVTNAKDMHR